MIDRRSSERCVTIEVMLDSNHAVDTRGYCGRYVDDTHAEVLAAGVSLDDRLLEFWSSVWVGWGAARSSCSAATGRRSPG